MSKNIHTIELPENPIIVSEDGNSSIFEIKPCYPGYGVTLGNALRRVLLSSLPGAAVTYVKIEKINHEFSGIPGVKEDVIEIMLAFKKLDFKIHEDASESVVMTLSVKGDKKVKAKDIKVPSSVEIMNPNLHIATLTSKSASLDIEIRAEQGVAYSSADEREKDEDKKIGLIALDAIFTPIRRVNYKVENMRVGERTDFNKLLLDIETDGTITPKEAFVKASDLLVEHFQSFGSPKKEKKVKIVRVAKRKPKIKEKPEEVTPELTIFDLKLSPRTMKALQENRIKAIKNLAKKSEEQLLTMSGLGEKGVKEIKREIGKLGILLKTDEASY